MVEKLAARVMVGLAIAFYGAAGLLAVTMPYKEWDALSYGEWSRLIAHTGNIRFDGIGSVDYHRPLFYIGQGLLWLVFGYHEWIGRLFSLLFSLILAASVWLIARHVSRRETVAGAAAVAVLAMSPIHAEFAAAGLTDIPAGAMVAATAAVAWVYTGRGRRLLLVIVAALAVTAKPTALTPLLGLLLATLIGPRVGLRRRAYETALPLTAGVGLGLVWDVVQARYVGDSLGEFMRAGVTDYYVDLAREARWDVLLSMDWFGGTLRSLLIFSLAYAATRAIGIRHSRAALTSAGVASLGWVVGPLLATGHFSFYPFASASAPEVVAQIALIAALWLAAACPEGAVPSRIWTSRLLVWAAPGTLIWLLYRADDLRLLGPSWAPLIVLMALSVVVVVKGAARIAPAAALVTVAAMAVVGAYNVSNLDGLGEAGWRQFRAMGIGGWRDEDRMRNLAYGPFSYELESVARELGADERVLSSDGKLRYFFPGRVTQDYPRTCAALHGYRVFVLLLDEESRKVMQDIGDRDDPIAWQVCRSPRLYTANSRANAYAVFAVGSPPRVTPTVEQCGLAVQPRIDFDAVFGSELELEEAIRLRKRAVSVGYTVAMIEQVSCDKFRVVVHGLPGPTNDLVREAATAGLRVRIEPGRNGLVVHPSTPSRRS